MSSLFNPIWTMLKQSNFLLKLLIQYVFECSANKHFPRAPYSMNQFQGGRILLEIFTKFACDAPRLFWLLSQYCHQAIMCMAQYNTWCGFSRDFLPFAQNSFTHSFHSLTLSLLHYNSCHFYENYGIYLDFSRQNIYMPKRQVWEAKSMSL